MHEPRPSFTIVPQSDHFVPCNGNSRAVIIAQSFNVIPAAGVRREYPIAQERSLNPLARHIFSAKHPNGGIRIAAI